MNQVSEKDLKPPRGGAEPISSKAGINTLLGQIILPMLLKGKKTGLASLMLH